MRLFAPVIVRPGCIPPHLAVQLCFDIIVVVVWRVCCCHRSGVVVFLLFDLSQHHRLCLRLPIVCVNRPRPRPRQSRQPAVTSRSLTITKHSPRRTCPWLHSNPWVWLLFVCSLVCTTLHRTLWSCDRPHHHLFVWRVVNSVSSIWVHFRCSVTILMAFTFCVNLSSWFKHCVDRPRRPTTVSFQSSYIVSGQQYPPPRCTARLAAWSTSHERPPSPSLLLSTSPLVRL